MKNSQAKKLSESFLNVDQKIIAKAHEIDDAKKLKQYIKEKPEEAKKPFYITATFKRATAIAACLAIVAVTAFALTNKTNNNITPNNDTSSGNNVSSNNVISNNSGENNQDGNVIYVTADTTDPYAFSAEMTASLHQKYISPKLQEKMDLYKDYKDKEVVYSVIVEIFTAEEYIDEGYKLANANAEVAALYQQYLKAIEEEDKAEADWRAFNKANPGNEPEIVEKRKELTAVWDEKEKIRKACRRDWEDLFSQIVSETCRINREERLKFATQFSEKDPVATSYNKWAFYMDLTAEEINILAEKGGYMFILSSGDYTGVVIE